MKPLRLSRRTVLRGLGTAIALPTLEAMTDGSDRWYGTAQAATPTPVRVMAFHFPHGVVLPQWVPATTGTNYALTPGLAPLAAHQKDFNVITGLQQTAWNKGPGGGHANGMANFATAVPSIATGAGGPSFDQVLAAEFGAATKFRSLIVNNEKAGSQAEGATTAHMNNISWAGPGVPAPAERDPMNLFATLVAAVPVGSAQKLPDASVAATLARKKSVLDYVSVQLNDLRRRVGATDRARLEAHTAGLREIERVLTASTSGSASASCTAPSPLADPTVITDGEGGRPVGVAPSRERARLHLRLIALAFRCDLTRYASFALCNGFDDRRAPEFGGGMVGHHQLTHNGGKYGAGEDIEMRFITFYAGLLAFLLDELRVVPEGAGNLLDNCLIYYGSEMAEGWHTADNMPVVLAGRAGGRVVTGRHLAFPKGTALAKAFLAILNLAGSKTTKFGLGGDTPLEGLTS